MIFLDFLASDQSGLAYLMRLLLITTPILFIGLLITSYAQRRVASTLLPSSVLRHTLLATGTAVLFTITMGTYFSPLLPLAPSPAPLPMVSSPIEQPVTLPNDNSSTGKDSVAALTQPTVPMQAPHSRASWGRQQTLSCYLFVTILLLSAYGMSAAVLLRVGQGAIDAPANLDHLLDMIGSRIATRKRRRPHLKISSEITSPLTIDFPGMRSPLLLLPISCVSDDTAQSESLSTILAHELAHLTRRDGHWTVAVRLMTVLLWFQPLLWLLAYRMECAAEFDCDREALRYGTDLMCHPTTRRNYATRLLAYAEAAMQEGFLIRSIAAERIIGKGYSHSSQFLKERIERIMEVHVHDQDVPQRSWRNRTTALLALVALSSIALFGATKAVIPAGAQPTPTPQDNTSEVALPIVSLNCTDVPVELALQEVLRGRGFTYKLSPAL